MEHNASMGEGKPLLVKTQTCPACRAAVALLDRAGVDYATVTDADSHYADAVERYGVRHVPTLILHPEGRWTSMVGTEAIRDYIQSRQ